MWTKDSVSNKYKYTNGFSQLDIQTHQEPSLNSGVWIDAYI